MYENPPRKQEKRENTVEDLFEVTRAIAKDVNKHVKEKYKTEHNLVNDNCAISMGFFAKERGGIYESNEIACDNAVINKLEMGWSGANEKSIQEFYKEQYGIEGAENIVKKHMHNMKRDKNAQMEMLTNAILHKVLKDRFIVVRASTYDDYVGGVDNYLVDKETGNIACAFDDVHDYTKQKISGEGESRIERKRKKVKECMECGGTKIKYGVVPQGDELKQHELRNIPVFYLSLTTEALIQGINGFSKNINEKPNEMEQKIFNLFISTLEGEFEKTKSMNINNPYLKKNLEKFKSALDTMKAIGRGVSE